VDPARDPGCDPDAARAFAKEAVDDVKSSGGAGASHEPGTFSFCRTSRAGGAQPPCCVSGAAGASVNGGGGIGGIGGTGDAPQSEPRAASSPGGAALDGLSLQLARGATATRDARARALAGPATTRPPAKREARAVRPAETVSAR